LSEANRTQVAILRSTARAVPLVAPQAFDLLRFTGTPNLAFEPNTIVSNEIRPDRQIGDLILVGADAGGDIGFELSFRAFDLLFESALFTTFAANPLTPVRAGVVQVTDINAGVIVVDDTTEFVVGHLCRLSGIDALNGDALRDGIYEISAIPNATDLTVLQHNGPAILTDLIGGVFTAAEVKVCGLIAQVDGEVVANAPVSSIASATFSGAALVALQEAMGSTPDPLVAGQVIKFGHTRTDAPVTSQAFATTANNVSVRIISVDTVGGVVTFIEPTGWAADAAATEQVAVYFGDFMPNPTIPDALTAHQFAIERSFLDHTPITRELFLGMAINTLSVNLTPQAIATATATFFGFNSHVRDQTQITELYAGGAPTRAAAPQNDVYNTSNNIGYLNLDGQNICDGQINLITELTIEINNNLRRRNAVCVFGAASIGSGELSISGTMNRYFDNKDELQRVLDNTEFSFGTGLRDGSGRQVIFDLPRNKYSGGAPDIPGKNQDVTIPLTYQSILDPALGYTISIQRMTFVG